MIFFSAQIHAKQMRQSSHVCDYFLFKNNQRESFPFFHFSTLTAIYRERKIRIFWCSRLCKKKRKIVLFPILFPSVSRRLLVEKKTEKILAYFTFSFVAKQFRLFFFIRNRFRISCFCSEPNKYIYENAS